MNKFHFDIFVYLLLILLCENVDKHKNIITLKDTENDYINHVNSIREDFKIQAILKRRSNTVYTQGLILSEEKDAQNKTKLFLYESGGLYGESSLKKYEYPFLYEVNEYLLPKKNFGEGIAICKASNKLYQLTYKEREILIYSYPQMNYLNTIPMNLELREGWGFSQGKNNNELYATDGTNQIFVLDCKKENLEIKSIISVTYNEKNITFLNDLVYAKGYIWCNRYFDSIIMKIDLKTGKIIKIYDMSHLFEYEKEYYNMNHQRWNRGDVLNGITYNENNDTFILTGKLWNNYYVVKFN